MTHNIGSAFFYTQNSDNTMAWAKEHLATAPDGAVFIAHELTHARGRQGRVWHWAPGQLALTIVLKPTSPTHEDDLVKLSMALACGIYEPIKKYSVTLKWPNDFVIDQKKVGGMLLELVWHDKQLSGIIFGFALNVNNTFKTTHEVVQRATSLCTHAHQSLDLPALQTALISSLNFWYNAWYARAYDNIFTTWVEAQSYLGKKITVHKKDGSIVAGTAQHLLPNGTLLLNVDQQTSILLSFHDVDFLT
ncbi:biotin--[acetyl-CoA-carboxylase] ligase [bacterium]|nr:MAG: biotin--[acetyl-CoA-carboxylase] ligase [bacterium]